MHIDAHFILPLASLRCWPPPSAAETIGSVDTAFKLIGPDHKVVVEVFDDPKVGGRELLSVARKKRAASRARSAWPRTRPNRRLPAARWATLSLSRQAAPKQEEVFSERASIFFKHVRVVRMVDAKRNALVYLVYSDRLVDGSPKNSVTAVPVPGNPANPTAITAGILMIARKLP